MGLAADIASALHGARATVADARAGALAAAETLAGARARLAAATDGSSRDEPVRTLAALEQAGQHIRQAAAAMSTCDDAVGGYTTVVLGFPGAERRSATGNPPTSD
ncbi:hypothetical protein [Phytomonospora endophytica]|uniref:Uncharacterized protein n=1 Tax=Phytomonospora endophytica TaxID=714109 RepID=A0A841FHN9_9ACTN|nr:hypothetical protein [Phytomonospora endophytica]MBB6035384.1 hypothetical protein [Phytomonospora endophytica]GIG63864.1 hypothetical protein Pen01_01590 [Phytomonospora endophytica]